MTCKGPARKRRPDDLLAKIGQLPPSRRKRLGAIARREIAKFTAEDAKDPDWAWGLRDWSIGPPVVWE